MRRLSLIAAAVAVLAGCSMAPKYERPAAPVSSTFPTGGVYATQPGAADAGARSANGVAGAEIGWRDFFVDARLQRLIDIALKNNRDLRTSVLNIQAAQAQYRIVRSELFPSVAAQAGQSKQRTPRDLSLFGQTISNSYSVGLNASWEIDLFGRVQSLKDQALAQYFSTAYARKAFEISLISQVASQYLQVLQADDLLQVTQQTLKTTQASYNIVKLQFDNGTASELDLSQSQTAVETAAANLQAQQRARAQAVNALALLIGEPIPEDLPAGMPLNEQDLLTDIPAGLPSDLLTRRPDIMEAEQNLLAANANIGAARAAFFPSISLTGSFGTLSPTLGGLFKPGSAAWSFAPTITLPIFQGGQNLANLDLANIQKNIQIAAYEKAIQSAFRDVADGLAARGTYDQQIQALERDTAAEQRRLDLSTMRYNQGVDSYLNVLTAQQDLYSVQQTLITVRTERLANLVNLYQALGGGWIEHTGDQPRPADAPAAPADVGAASTPQAASAAVAG
ncbi:efflux transporter outer membrane subunit [Caballeronia sp. LZ062]|uniref:efflux transporter outer membrane subunit n=1 Tax=unclassified Caballeronia TaxID=2646786 RepID=UPI00285AF46C|nr:MULTISPECIES: efflux transporter outer membrane subunit [unclassified Caballeronia]MDR5853735.1 efflux transporter outer membrane subunit [Caballeronia sp. LZ050]MDR5871733.1 efflux transporter outer membrane subunit [Caballeronia sp. LZ062]